MPDYTIEANERLMQARAAMARRKAAATPTEAQLAHQASQKALDEAKALCDEACGVDPENAPKDSLELELAVAEAEAHHAPHREALEAAYAEFARTSHLLGDTPQAPSNPAEPGEHELSSHVTVALDIPAE